MSKGISRYSFWHSTYYDDTVECRHFLSITDGWRYFLSVTDVIILITEDDVILSITEDDVSKF